MIVTSGWLTGLLALFLVGTIASAQTKDVDVELREAAGIKNDPALAQIQLVDRPHDPLNPIISVTGMQGDDGWWHVTTVCGEGSTCQTPTASQYVLSQEDSRSVSQIAGKLLHEVAQDESKRDQALGCGHLDLALKLAQSKHYSALECGSDDVGRQIFYLEHVLLRGWHPPGFPSPQR